MEERYQTEVQSRYTTTDTGVAAFISKVYAFMAGALVVTALAAYYGSQSAELINFIYGNRTVLFGLFIVEILLVGVLSARINKMSYSTAALIFVGYSLLNGITLSSIFLLYTQSSLTATFAATAGTFGAMSLLGYFTKKDLTKFGGIMYMALIGLIIASVVNWIWPGPTMYMIITYAGVLIFVGLTAYDTQKIKRIGQELDINTEQGKKAAILGALSLYLDFINLFLLLLRFLGSRD